jgi:arylsulfatase B
MLLLALLALVLPNLAPATHIILMVLDDVGHSDTTITQTDKIVGYNTPNLKRLALEHGAVLGNYYTQTVCSPTRSALMTGRWPFTMGMQHVTTLVPGSVAHLPLTTPTLPEILKHYGYESHMVGKWHLGYAAPEYTPTGRGFHTFYGYLQGQIDYFNKTVLGSQVKTGGLDFWDAGLDFNTEYRQVDRSAIGTYSLDLYEKRVEDLLQKYNDTHGTAAQRKKHPLFLYYAHQSVHIPLEARSVEPSSRCGKAGKTRQVYCAMMMELDDAIGRFEAALHRFNMWDDALWIVTTDNGGMVPWTSNTFPPSEVPFPGSVGSNYPLRGSKTTLFEGGVRALAFITGGVLSPQDRGTKRMELMHAVDLPAMAVRVASIRQRTSFGDGHALTQIRLRCEDSLPESVLAATSAPPRSDVPINIINSGKSYSAIRFGDFKLIVGPASPPPGIKVLEGWYPANAASAPELPAETRSPHLYLFDVVRDPEERDNLVFVNRTLVKEGLLRLARYASMPEYIEPQVNFPHLLSWPALHHGAWAPFLKHAGVDAVEVK